MWEHNNGRVEDAEKCTVLGLWMLAGRREELPQPSGMRRSGAAVMWEMEVHEGPALDNAKLVVAATIAENICVPSGNCRIVIHAHTWGR